MALRKTGEMNKGLGFFAREMYRREGFSCFYKVIFYFLNYFLQGYVPNLIGIIPYAGIDLAIYETLKSLYVSRHSDITEPGVLVKNFKNFIIKQFRHY